MSRRHLILLFIAFPALSHCEWKAYITTLSRGLSDEWWPIGVPASLGWRREPEGAIFFPSWDQRLLNSKQNEITKETLKPGCSPISWMIIYDHGFRHEHDWHYHGFFDVFFSIKMTMNWGLIPTSIPSWAHPCQASMLWPVWLVPPSRRRIYKALRRPGRKNSPESQCVFKGFLCEGLRDWGCHWLSPKSLSYLSYAYTGYPCLVCFWTLEHWNVQGNIDKHQLTSLISKWMSIPPYDIWVNYNDLTGLPHWNNG